MALLCIGHRRVGYMHFGSQFCLGQQTLVRGCLCLYVHQLRCCQSRCGRSWSSDGGCSWCCRGCCGGCRSCRGCSWCCILGLLGCSPSWSSWCCGSSSRKCLCLCGGGDRSGAAALIAPGALDSSAILHLATTTTTATRWGRPKTRGVSGDCCAGARGNRQHRVGVWCYRTHWDATKGLVVMPERASRSPHV